jgi:hypothetical protein
MKGLYTVPLGLLLVTMTIPAVAQERPALTRPADWLIRTDRPDADTTSIEFVGMPPGWHVTTGPSLILWSPARTASGTFRLETEIFFFREGSRDTEGYGVLVGGRNLDRDDQDYLYFLLRNDGAFLVKHRAGTETHVIQDWTPHAAVARHTGEGGATVKNVIVVVAEDATVRFLVNDQEVAAFSREHMNVDGVVGLRVNHGLNLHVTRLDVK